MQAPLNPKVEQAIDRLVEAVQAAREPGLRVEVALAVGRRLGIGLILGGRDVADQARRGGEVLLLNLWRGRCQRGLHSELVDVLGDIVDGLILVSRELAQAQRNTAAISTTPANTTRPSKMAGTTT